MNLTDARQSLKNDLAQYKGDKGKYIRLKQAIVKKMLIITFIFMTDEQNENNQQFIDEIVLSYMLSNTQRQLSRLKHNPKGALDLIIKRYLKQLNKNMVIQ